MDKLKRVAIGTGATAKYTDDELRIVGNELFQCLRTVERILEKLRALVFQNAGKAAHQVVVDELADRLRRNARFNVGVEHFQKVLDAVGRSVFPEDAEGFQRAQVGLDVVDECH